MSGHIPRLYQLFQALGSKERAREYHPIFTAGRRGLDCACNFSTHDPSYKKLRYRGGELRQQMRRNPSSCGHHVENCSCSRKMPPHLEVSCFLSSGVNKRVVFVLKNNGKTQTLTSVLCTAHLCGLEIIYDNRIKRRDSVPRFKEANHA